MTTEKRAQELIGKEVTNISKDLIVTGAWKKVKIKPYGVENPGKVIYPGKKHHYAAFLDWVKSRLVALGFKRHRACRIARSAREPRDHRHLPLLAGRNRRRQRRHRGSARATGLAAMPAPRLT